MTLFRVLLAFALTLALATTALAADKDIVFINKTFTKITAIYISPAGMAQPGENLLKRVSLKHGKNANIQMPHDMGDCMYDIQYVSNKDKAYTIKNVNICTTAELTVFLKKGETWATAK